MAQYRKFLVAASAALGVAGTAVADGKLTAAEGIAIAVAFLGALGVYGVRNEVVVK
jgi:hypothetical protein